jgi:SAM-dependent methyltransferase
MREAHQGSPVPYTGIPAHVARVSVYGFGGHGQDHAEATAERNVEQPAMLDQRRSSGDPPMHVLTDIEYRPFPNEAPRNWRQEHVEIPLMLLLLGLPRGGRVLELGCGRGIALPVLARSLQPIRLVGLDQDRTLLDEATCRLTGSGVTAELVLGDIRRLPFPNGDFDLIIDFGTCFHVGGADRALREITRALAPNGIFATETKLNQLFSHPVRSLARSIPWETAAGLARARHAGLWQSWYRRA